ncbi:hypothetical protein [Haladaptatus halobius]|uniref:hypothetical protein n=1 Tax=Haladaptatus halobius TaxID=2884875 RepID=UPI001D0BAFAD|nr:hypothetical protein [Haladaptatus halobius]
MTASILGIAFVEVIPTPGIYLAGIVVLAIVFAGGYAVLAIDVAHPFAIVAASSLFVIAAFDLLSTGRCLTMGCSTPPGYDPWSNLKVFLRWSVTGPTLELSSEPYQCAVACPYRIELVPLILSYAAVWYGFERE